MGWWKVLGTESQFVYRVARPPGTEVRIADAQLAYECDQVWVVGVLAGFHP